MSISVAPIGRLRLGARVSAAAPEIFAGSTVTWFGEFRDPITNALTSASGVEFTLLAPDGLTVIGPYSGALQSTGIYAANVAPADVGLWSVRLHASGVRVDERTFAVLSSVIPDDADDAVVLVDDDGEYILLDDGTAMEG